MMNCGQKKSHRLYHPKYQVAHQPSAQGPQWPSFTGTAVFVGTSQSGKVTVYYDPTLGGPGFQNAQDLLADADRIVQANDAIFGTVGGAVNVIVFALGGATDGTGGADHAGCDYTTGQNIEVCASFGNSARVSALLEAELSECSMGGNLCGLSTGEALSRWCAMVTSNNALDDFASAPAWVQAGMPNWVDRVQPTDQDYPSIGCGMAFLSWLQSLGYPLALIASAMVLAGDSGTLSGLYAAMTGDMRGNAWPKFQAAVKALPNGVQNDDPFKGSVPPPPPPPPTSNVKQVVDQAFADLESKASPGLRYLLIGVQRLVDTWLIQHGYGTKKAGEQPEEPVTCEVIAFHA